MVAETYTTPSLVYDLDANGVLAFSASQPADATISVVQDSTARGLGPTRASQSKFSTSREPIMDKLPPSRLGLYGGHSLKEMAGLHAEISGPGQGGDRVIGFAYSRCAGD